MLNISIYKKSIKEMHNEEIHYKENCSIQDQINKLKLDINELYSKVNDICKAIDSQYMDLKVLSNGLSKLNEELTIYETNNRANTRSRFNLV